MKIQCQSCQAKYTIADEKVLGKVVKIRCKKCSATIVINGNETRPAEENADTHVFDYAGQANDQWTVNVADGDQRTMTGQEIVAEYRAGVVNDETYCWKDGMADWLPVREIEQLYGAIKLAPTRERTHSIHEDDLSVPPQSIPPAANAGAAALFSSHEAQAAVESPFAGGGGANGNGNGYHAPEPAYAAPAAAARRGGGRGQGADLFGNVASAGGEEDVMTSAASGGASHGGGGGGGGAMEEQKLTGQRNESSVLFSLSALTEGGKAETAASANRTTATSDGSGLIDIRALSQTMGSDDKKDTNARVDDIMNLSGGGAFGAALAAPILAPPPLEMTNDAYAQGGGGEKSNKMLLIAIVAGAAMIAIGIVVAVVLTRPSVPPVEASNPTTTASGLGTAAPGAVASNDPAAAAATAPAATADNTPPPPGTGNASGKTPAVTGGTKTPAATGGGGAAHTAAVAAADPAPAVPKTPEPPKDFAGALAAAAGKPKEAPAETGGGGSTAPFDRGAAQGALGGVNVQSCKKPDGPTGSGHVKITFAPNGSVSSAVVDGGPFPGTPVGGCIAGKFRGAHVPPFGGGPVSVGKSFTIN
jgi:predicted Zn finger-like uncharacterized protein